MKGGTWNKLSKQSYPLSWPSTALYPWQLLSQVWPLWLTEILMARGAWVAQLVEEPTLDFSPGHDPRVVGSNPVSDSVLNMEPAWDPLSLSLCPTPPSPSQIKILKRYKKKRKNEILMAHMGGRFHNHDAIWLLLQFYDFSFTHIVILIWLIRKLSPSEGKWLA